MNIGVIGLGMMGLTHLDAYGRRNDVKILAISDADPERLSGKTRAIGNVEGQAQGGVDALADVRRYPDGMELINGPDVELVDICLPTDMHRRFAEAALARGKHVLVEKPLALNSTDAQAIADAAEKASGQAMVGQCVRFWPGWDWLKQAVARKTYGRVNSAHFRRLVAHPTGHPFYSHGEKCGGAILDLHIHDTDFVHYCFGKPAAVYSRGYSSITGAIDHVFTQYIYDGDGPPMVAAEGGWTVAQGFPFQSTYMVNFERATAVYNMGAENPLLLYRDGKSEPVAVSSTLGYDLEIDYFLKCIRSGKRPEQVTLGQAADSIRIVEAERRSIETGQITPIGG